MDGKRIYNRKQLLDQYRKSILPEYNTHKKIVKMDFLVDKIRELNPKDEADAIDTLHGFKFEARISYPHSLGENGNTTTFIYKGMPNVEHILKDVVELYTEEIADINKEIVLGIVAKSGRNERIEQAIKEALKKSGYKKNTGVWITHS